MQTRLLITILIMAFLYPAMSQTVHRCKTDEIMEQTFGKNPAFKKEIENSFKNFYKKPKQKSVNPPIYTIPVHVIIVHPPGQAVGTGDNLSLAHIESQITVLNEDFRRTNSDSGNTPPVFPAGDSEIEFCLASTDPDGNPTDGVTRYGTNQNLDNNEFAIKSATGWPRADYLNVWVGDLPGGLLGWAYLPTTTSLPNATLDGIVVETTSFGGPGFATGFPYDLGRTATHEVGHYLGLRHVWGNGGCGSDDGIADTPIQSGSNFGCPNHPDPSCGNGGDMFMNYMDYVNDDCMNAFTVEQGDYMRTILETSRASILNSAAVNCSGSSAALSAFVSSQVDVLCHGDATGSLTIQASGGVPPYMYSINGGGFQSDPTFANLTAGTYLITVEDADGSSVVFNGFIVEPDPLILTVDNQGDASCFGIPDGSITVSGSGGTALPGGIYLYSFDGAPFSPQNSFPGLSAGTYNISIKDQNDCENLIVISIGQPEDLELAINDLINVDCFDNETGEVDLLAFGGTPGYNFSLDEVNYQTSGTFDNLSVGSYTAYVEDNNNCQSQINFSIIQPELLFVIPLEITDVLCFGESSGSVLLESFGGTGEYQYSMNGGDFQGDPFFSDLGFGVYEFVVQDENGCQGNTTVDIDEPLEILPHLIGQTDVECAGDNSGTLTITAFGGSGSYTYSNGIESNSSGFFSGLVAGVYTIDVMDSNGCSAILVAEIVENGTLNINLTGIEQVSCFGTSDGSAIVTGNGGDGNYQYSIDNGPFSAVNNFQNLSAGTHSVVVLDGNGCSQNLQFEITQPNEVVGVLEVASEPSCFGFSDGNIEVNASGGDGNYQFSLNGTTNSSGTFSGLASGSYNIAINDSNGCLGTIAINLAEPDVLNASLINVTNVDCFGNDSGSISVQASGGTGDYSYTLDNESNSTGTFDNLTAGTYSFIVSDENSCTTSIDASLTEPEPVEASISSQTNEDCLGNNNGTIQVEAEGGSGMYLFSLGNTQNATGLFEGLGPNSYEIQVFDAFGCETVVEAEIIAGNDVEISLLNQIDLNCFGSNDGIVELEATGGTGGYQYELEEETNTTGYFSNLGGGTYTVSVTDEIGCNTNYEIDIYEPEALTLTISNTTDVDCYSEKTGTITAQANGGSGTYTYSLGDQNSDAGSFGGLEAGTYEIIVTDENDCTAAISAEIQEPTEITSMLVSSNDVSCFGGSDGNVQVEAAGGNGGFEYTLNGLTNTTGTFSNLEEGSYEISILDVSNCPATISVSVAAPEALELNLESITNINCSDDPIGAIEVSANGGNGGFEYTLDGMSNTSGLFENLEAGSYIINVEDANGCENNISVTVLQTDELGAEVATVTNVDCYAGANGTVQIQGLGGSGNFTFTLDGLSNETGVFEDLGAGSYSVFIEDDFGCNTTIDFDIAEPEQLIATASQVGEIACFGDENGSIQVIAAGGAGGYSYALGFENNNSGLFESLSAGSYSVFVTDANGCGTNTSASIASPDQLEGNVSQVVNIDCFGNENGSVLLESTGGTGDVNYQVADQDNTSGVFENLSAGTYEAILTDENNCTSELSFDINEPEPIVIQEPVVENALCNGESTGSVIVAANGGVGDLVYTLNGESNSTGVFENVPAGDYEIEVMDANDCISSIEASVEEPSAIMMEVIDIQNDTGSDNGFFNIEISGGTPPYQFSLDGIDFSPGIPFNGLSAGIYTGYAMDANGCIVTVEVEIMLETSVSEPQAGLEFLEVFPNPFSEGIWVELVLSEPQDLQFRLYNVQGIEILNYQKNLQVGESNLLLSVENHLPTGTYILNVSNKRFNKYFKLVKQ